MAAPEFWLTTDRLALRRFTEDDFEWLVGLYSDADVMRYVGGPKTREAIRQQVDIRILNYYDEHPGLGVWATVERSTRALVGFHALNQIWGETIEQVGFFLAKAAWGRGYGTEMGEALLRYGFRDLALPRIVGMADLDNLASQRVLAKIGLHRNGERAFPHPAYVDAGPMAWFERNREEWLAERGG
jgi:RimJ/RimL family protein N-acetyltransferase